VVPKGNEPEKVHEVEAVGSVGLHTEVSVMAGEPAGGVAVQVNELTVPSESEAVTTKETGVFVPVHVWVDEAGQPIVGAALTWTLTVTGPHEHLEGELKPTSPILLHVGLPPGVFHEVHMLTTRRPLWPFAVWHKTLTGSGEM